VIWPEFGQAWWLLLLLVVPPLLWWHHRGGRRALAHSDTSWLRRLPLGRTVWARRGGTILRGLAMVLLIIALAGPRWPDPGTRLPTQGIAIMMVADVSRSMGESWQGEENSRLDALKRVFRLFVQGGPTGDGERLDGRPNDAIGLVTFAPVPDTTCRATLSHGALLQLLDSEQPRGTDEAGTNIGDALAWGLHHLRAVDVRRRVLVLLTDGIDESAQPFAPRQAAQTAAALGIPIYVIDAAGDKSSENDAKPRVHAKNILEEIAKITDGMYLEAHDTKSLIEAYAQLDRMERAQIKTFQYRRYYEGFVSFALGAFVLLVTLQSLEHTVWRRVP
jgi:Ca-activated chloride channel family protein